MKNNKAKHELWRRGILSWKLHPVQLIVYIALRALPKSIREAVVLIARRWGKSYLGVLMAIEDCIRNPNKQVFIVGPSIKQTRRIITPIIRDICADAPPGMIKQTKSDLTWAIDDSTLLIGAFDTALESFRGLEAFSIYLEESGLADSQEYEYTLKSVLGPALMNTQGRIHHLTTPPREEDHPFVTTTVPSAILNNSYYTYTIEDNPRLSKEEIESEIKAAGGRGSEHCERELFCKIVKDRERLLLPEFDESIHVKDIVKPSHSFFITSIDFGGTKDPHAGLLGYYDFERNKVCIIDETWLPINTGTDEIIKAHLDMETRNNVAWLKGSPQRVIDAPGQVLTDIKRLGYSGGLPQKGKDSVSDGIQALRTALTKGSLEIHPKCIKLITTCKYGRWDKNKEDFQRTDALGHCDPVAALSYLFRHIDRSNNPFPQHLGLNRDDHYFERDREYDNMATLDTVFYDD